MWKLKESENKFQVTREGPFEYHTFIHGEIYNSIPTEEKPKFEEVIDSPKGPAKKKVKGGEEE